MERAEDNKWFGKMGVDGITMPASPGPAHKSLKERMAIKIGFSSGIVSTRLANNILLTAETG